MGGGGEGDAGAEPAGEEKDQAPAKKIQAITREGNGPNPVAGTWNVPYGGMGVNEVSGYPCFSHVEQFAYDVFFREVRIRFGVTVKVKMVSDSEAKGFHVQRKPSGFRGPLVV